MQPQQAWDIAYRQLELQMDRSQFDTWLREARYLGHEGSQFIIGVRNTYIRDMLTHRLQRLLTRVLSDAYGEDVGFRFEITNSKTAEKDKSAAATPTTTLPMFEMLSEQPASPPDADSSLGARVASPGRSPIPEGMLNPRFTFDRFMVGSSNRLAFEMARSVSQAPGRTYNPICIYGGSGLGKTHLLQAIAHVCLAAGKRTVYVPSEAFTNDVVEAIHRRTTALLREKYRSADVLLIDDVQFLAGKEVTQEEFFHTFNALYEAGKQIVIASDKPPRDLTGLEERLRSRFAGGLMIDIGPLELETRMAIVQMWAQEHHVRFSPSVVQVIAESARTTVRDLEGAFNQIVAKSRMSHAPITKELAERMLLRVDSPRNHARAITAEGVVSAVAACFGLSEADLTGKGRTQRVSIARQVAMLLAREYTDLSLVQIGKVIGGRQHNTIISGLKRIQEQIAGDAQLAEQVTCARQYLMN